jgi:probable F420-dependent oxidoreductase
MKYGIIFANTGPFAEPEGAAAMAVAAEQVGFESIWTVEHVVVPVGYESTYPYDRSGKMPGNDDAPVPDPLIWLTWLAARTSTIRLATGILILPQRNPVVLAKELATLDYLSGGRVDFGIGVGWLAEEFDALGIPFAERGARTDDAVGALRALWSEDVASYEGRFTSFSGCISKPQPVNGSIPIHVGGHSEAAARRAGRLGDGFFPGEGNHTKLAHLIEVARNEAAEAGRDPAALEITSGGRGVFGSDSLAEVTALAELGVDRIVVPSFLFYRDTADTLAAFGRDVIAKS